MKSRLQAHLRASPQQAAKLRRLQAEFSQVCNAIAPHAQRTRCWNRVALHHMVYHSMRERFPTVGSQMVCNAIYAVSRTCRVVYQSPDSPFNIQRNGAAALPLVQFAPEAPVYFDRHTLSIKDGVASLYTLDGRMHFETRLPPDDLNRLARERVREIVLTGRGNQFTLTFMLDDTAGDAAATPATTTAARKRAASEAPQARAPLPGYVQVLAAPAQPAQATLGQEAR